MRKSRSRGWVDWRCVAWVLCVSGCGIVATHEDRLPIDKDTGADAGTLPFGAGGTPSHPGRNTPTGAAGARPVVRHADAGHALMDSGNTVLGDGSTTDATPVGPPGDAGHAPYGSDCRHACRTRGGGRSIIIEDANVANDRVACVDVE